MLDPQQHNFLAAAVMDPVDLAEAALGPTLGGSDQSPASAALESLAAVPVGLAWVDLSTATFLCGRSQWDRLFSDLARYPPAELLLPQPLLHWRPPASPDPAFGAAFQEALREPFRQLRRGAATGLESCFLSLRRQEPLLQESSSGWRLPEELRPLVLDPEEDDAGRGKGLESPDPEWWSSLDARTQRAVALLLDYVRWTQRGDTPVLSPPTPLSDADLVLSVPSRTVEEVREPAVQPSPPSSTLPPLATLVIDPTTARALELHRPARGRRRGRGSLIHTLDHTKTAPGARLLDNRLAAPLADARAIRSRLDAVEWLLRRPALRDAVRAALSQVGDFERSLQRLTLGRGRATPRDLAVVRDSVLALRRVGLLLVSGDHMRWHPNSTPPPSTPSSSAAEEEMSAHRIVWDPPVWSWGAEGGDGTSWAPEEMVPEGVAGLSPAGLLKASSREYDAAQPVHGREGSSSSREDPGSILSHAACTLLWPLSQFAEPTAVHSADPIPLASRSASPDPQPWLALAEAHDHLRAALVEQPTMVSGAAAGIGPAGRRQRTGVDSKKGTNPLPPKRGNGGKKGEEESEDEDSGMAWSDAGSFIRRGYCPALDEVRELREGGWQAVERVQDQLRDVTGIRLLKLRRTAEQGFTAEVPGRFTDAMQPFLGAEHGHRFVWMRTLKNSVRYKCRELTELDKSLADAHARASELEALLFDDLCGRVRRAAPALTAWAKACAVVDVAAGLAEAAARLDLKRPQIVAPDEEAEEGASGVLRMRSGRHLVVETALLEGWAAEPGGRWEDNVEDELVETGRVSVRDAKEEEEGEEEEEGKVGGGGSLIPRTFVANDIDLAAHSPSEADAGRVWVLTGPNMGGKSTYLRQVAQLVVLAQMGSFVPADEALIGVVDRIFTRVGASDDVARDRSTFMVEMEEVAAILRQATHRSLVVVDEVGRGTSARDGLAIAAAVLHHLAHDTRARTLFATHFHELAVLASDVPPDLENPIPDSLPAHSPAAPVPRQGSLLEALKRSPPSELATANPIRCRAMGVRNSPEGPALTYRVEAGVVGRSFGLHVAAQAGLPPSVLRHAQTVMDAMGW